MLVGKLLSFRVPSFCHGLLLLVLGSFFLQFFSKLHFGDEDLWWFLEGNMGRWVPIHIKRQHAEAAYQACWGISAGRMMDKSARNKHGCLFKCLNWRQQTYGKSHQVCFEMEESAEIEMKVIHYSWIFVCFCKKSRHNSCKREFDPFRRPSFRHFIAYCILDFRWL